MPRCTAPSRQAAPRNLSFFDMTSGLNSEILTFSAICSGVLTYYNIRIKFNNGTKLASYISYIKFSLFNEIIIDYIIVFW